MVMRSDGGATDLAGFSAAPGAHAVLRARRRRSPARCATPGSPTRSSSRSAARRRTSPRIRDGRPALSYVQVASHATALRSVDVRVVGVAGGSMLRVRRGRVHGVGPRSAHIAGLRYACVHRPRRASPARPSEIVAPLPGDPADYVDARAPPTASASPLTNTCAANPLGIAEPADYCYAAGDAARAAFELVAARDEARRRDDRPAHARGRRRRGRASWR